MNIFHPSGSSIFRKYYLSALASNKRVSTCNITMNTLYDFNVYDTRKMKQKIFFVLKIQFIQQNGYNTITCLFRELYFLEIAQF